jgi:hypothetical protein
MESCWCLKDGRHAARYQHSHRVATSAVLDLWVDVGGRLDPPG